MKHRDHANRGSFFHGFITLFKSLGFIFKHHGFAWYFIIPFILNLVILITAFYFTYQWFDSLFSSLISGTAWYITVIRILLKPVLFALLAIAMILVYSISGCIITAPFNDLISRKTETIVANADYAEPFNAIMLLKDILRITVNIIILLTLVILLNVIVLLVNLIPFFGQIAYMVISFLMASFFIGFQFFDFPMERRRLSFSRKFWIAWQHKRLVSGLGAGFFLISYIPIIGFLGLNLGAVGSTLLFLEFMKNEAENPPPAEKSPS